MSVSDDLAQELDGNVPATSLMLSILDSNARASEAVSNRLQESLEADRDRWRDRALVAEELVDAMERNMLAMLYRGTALA